MASKTPIGTPNSKGSHAARNVGLIIILAIIVLLIRWIYDWVNDSIELQHKLVDRGCIPLTSDKYGFGHNWRCPEDELGLD